MQIGRRITVEARHPGVLFFSLATFAVVLDQLTKAFIRHTMLPATSIPVIEGVFHITFVRNMGAAFGLMPGRQPLFIATSLAVVLGTLGYWLVKRPRERWLVISLGLIVGGALGNLIDRTTGPGLVTDFFDFTLIDFPVFNIADMAIVGGVIMLVIWVLFAPDPEDVAEEPLAEPDAPAIAEEPPTAPEEPLA